MANKKNLRPGEYKFTHEDQVAGGIASGKARHEIATMKKTLNAMLKQTNEQTGNTFEEDITLGIITGAIFGKAENYKIIAQMTGALENEEQTGTPQVNINIVDNSDLEKVLYEDENE